MQFLVRIWQFSFRPSSWPGPLARPLFLSLSHILSITIGGLLWPPPRLLCGPFIVFFSLFRMALVGAHAFSNPPSFMVDDRVFCEGQFFMGLNCKVLPWKLNLSRTECFFFFPKELLTFILFPPRKRKTNAPIKIVAKFPVFCCFSFSIFPPGPLWFPFSP